MREIGRVLCCPLDEGLVSLLLVHALVEVLIGRHLEEVEFIVDGGQTVTVVEVLPEPLDFLCLFRVTHHLLLSLLVQILRRLPLLLLGRAVIAPVLVGEALEARALSLPARLVRLERLHELLSACDRPVEAAPDLLRLVHEGVALGDLHTLDDVLLRQDLLVRVRQLEHLIGQALLRTLVLLQLRHVHRVRQELRQHLRVPPDVVHVRWVLRLPVIQ